MGKLVRLLGFATVVAIAAFLLAGCGNEAPEAPPADGGGGGQPVVGETVRGSVLDAGTGAPIVGAVVTLGAASATTGSSGTYEFRGVTAGSQTLGATATGYLPASGLSVVVPTGVSTVPPVLLVPEGGRPPDPTLH